MPVPVPYPTRSILGVRVYDITRAQTLELIDQMIASHEPHLLVTPNVDYITQAQRNRALFEVLNRAELSVPDGMGVIYASRLLGKPLRQNVGGRLLVPAICARAAAQSYRVGFLGARPGVAERAAARMRAAYPGLVIPFVEHGYFTSEDEPRLVARARESALDVLVVAMGTPRQELFMARHQGSLDAPVMLGVGSTFDRLSGDVALPPAWMTAVGLEWLFRIFQDPKRLGRRYLIEDPIFFVWVLQQRLGARQFPLFSREGGQ